MAAVVAAAAAGPRMALGPRAPEEEAPVGKQAVAVAVAAIWLLTAAGRAVVSHRAAAARVAQMAEIRPPAPPAVPAALPSAEARGGTEAPRPQAVAPVALPLAM